MHCIRDQTLLLERYGRLPTLWCCHHFIQLVERWKLTLKSCVSMNAGRTFDILFRLSTKLADSSPFWNELEARTTPYTLRSVFISGDVILITVFGQIRAGICTRRKTRVRSCNWRRVIEIPLPSELNEWKAIFIATLKVRMSVLSDSRLTPWYSRRCTSW